jgi:hypothetical protein
MRKLQKMHKNLQLRCLLPHRRQQSGVRWGKMLGLYDMCVQLPQKSDFSFPQMGTDRGGKLGKLSQLRRAAQANACACFVSVHDWFHPAQK